MCFEVAPIGTKTPEARGGGANGTVSLEGGPSLNCINGCNCINVNSANCLAVYSEGCQTKLNSDNKIILLVVVLSFHVVLYDIQPL